MFTFTDVMHFLAHKFPSLCACGFPLPSVFARALDRLFFRHSDLLTSSLGW